MMVAIRRLRESPWVVPAMAMAGLFAAAATGPMSSEIGLCPYRNLFGVSCPGCGLSRGSAALLQGDVGSALAFHPLAPLALAQIVAGAVLWFGHKRGWWTVRSRSIAIIGSINVVLLLGVWAIRAVTGTLPPA